MRIVTQSPSHIGEIAELFVVTNVRPRYDQNTFPQRLCYLGIINLGASGSLNRYDLGVLANFRRPGLTALLKLVSLFWILRPTLFRISSNMSGSNLI